ncbi:2-hydroxycarboxylate transporter family protein [Desulfobaculum bizertense]|uniref:Citrate carrier protein, CCS family n=1 Tax=Desulfobaculum bizertense DSM 18034 TaxID=1121442 RepID=A0A1T4VRE4_9BACT|nr:2-hydroxycarboxylate transporter family protein [Desulfobaculum bizertense]UIJ38332.1 2-hydroxycarboxylate transporter family protein [Desulfobaculum bizertense]SKA67517.1 citrate carrier protein, CCS family [Desulfobaculum bizertense DSM 18034]
MANAQALQLNTGMKEGYRIMGMSLTVFCLFSVIIFVSTYAGVLPGGMVGAFPLMMILGAVLGEIGDKTPIVKDYFGGGPILIIFGSAALLSYGILPVRVGEIITSFMKKEGFLSFYIAALICGSILGMDRKLLIKAAIRYLPVILGGVSAALLLCGTVGMLIGYGFTEAVLYIALPIMGGGMGAGAVPLSQIFGSSLHVDVGTMLSKMVPALALGNAFAIVAGGLLHRLGKVSSKLSGQGKLLKNQEAESEKENSYAGDIDYKSMGIGLLLATTFFVWGKLLGSFIPIHSYALMIISVGVVKALGLMPHKYEKCAFQWFRFVMTALTPALLVGIGIAYTNLQEVLDAFTIQYVILVAMTVIGAIIGSGLIGMLLGFYPVEAAITGGLCMANMGGTGDVAVLSASKRMGLMPFAQISSRIGGAFMLILATALIKLFI